MLHPLSFSRSDRALRWLAVALASLLTAGCGAAAYYAQLVRGQTELLVRARPIDQWLDDPEVAPALHERLSRIDEIVRFGVTELGLRDAGNYRDYVQLDRDAMVWSVVAAPVDSLQAREWCFPVLGCVSYRGYFGEPDAREYADSLAAEGWDVAVLAVPAYSTLGWFSDPLPSTVAHWPIHEIAGLLFHEMAHATLYVRDDSEFNEAYATVIEREGVARWLERFGSEVEREAWRQRSERRRDFLGLIQSAREQLTVLYRGDHEVGELLPRKRAVFSGLKGAYAELRDCWQGYAGYDRWFDRPLNNAHLASVSTYNRLVPALRRLLHDVDGDMPAFQQALAELAGMRPEQRRDSLPRPSSATAVPAQSVEQAGSRFSKAKLGCRVLQ